MRKSLLFFVLVALPFLTRAQQQQESDTIPTRQLDSIGTTTPNDEIVRIQSYAARLNPQRALLLSAILPGTGQVYNKAYWKVPIIYGGFVVGGYAIHLLHQERQQFKDALFSLLNEPASPIIVDNATGLTSLGNYELPDGRVVSSLNRFNIDQLRNYVNRWERDRNFVVMLTGLWYILQMVEAHVDAHLKEFDVNPQLKVSVEPSIRSTVLTGRTSGVALTFKF